MLVSGIQQSDSVIHKYIFICIHVLFHILFHYGLLQDIEYVLYSRTSLFIYFIYSNLYLLIPNSLFIPSLPPFSFGNQEFVFYVCESVSVS